MNINQISSRDSTSSRPAAANGAASIASGGSIRSGRSITSNDREVRSGVLTMQAIRRKMTTADYWRIFGSIFVFAFAYGQDGLLRYVYQPYATASFDAHSTLATVNVLRAVIGAAAYPPTAKLADVFGRPTLLCVSLFFYVIGTIVDATCKNVEGFCAGAVLYQLGFTAILLLVEILVADLTPLNRRLFFSTIPILHFLVNTWISGNVSDAVLGITSWRWGIGMYAIIVPATSIPVFVSLYIPWRRAKMAGDLDGIESPRKGSSMFQVAIDLFWQLDLLGSLLVIAMFSFILVPFTIAGGSDDPSEQWKRAKILAPLLVGVLFMLPSFIIWEKYWAQHPLVPTHLLRDRAIWAGLGVACMLNFCWYMQGDFLFTVLIVAFDQSIMSATRITSLYSFVSVFTSTVLGLIVLKVRRLKPFILAGCALMFVAFGMLIHFRGGDGSGNYSGIVAAQIMLGLAGGLIPYPAQASVQAATRHENVAVITGVFMATYSVGSALGNALSGAIWSHTLVPTLLNTLPSGYNNITTAESIYASPFVWVLDYPLGSPIRDGIIVGYRHTQKLLTITGICLCIPLFVFSLCLRNPRLGDEQTAPDAEERAHGEDRGTRMERLRNLWR